MKWIIGISFFIFILSSCQLNGKQEEKLHKDLLAYLNARNNHKILSFVSFQAPCLIEKYKNQGDSVFQTRYNLAENPKYNSQLDNHILRGIEKDNELIQVKYRMDFNKNTDEFVDLVNVFIYAISTNKGESWYFMEEEEYNDKSLCPDLKRLFKD